LANLSPQAARDGSAEFVRWSGVVDGVPGNAGADKVTARYIKADFSVNIWVFLDEIKVLGVE